jgi:hypothetical protein
MSIVNAGDPEHAFFRRKSSFHHISADCVRSNMQFNDQKYDENKFNTKDMFEYILSVPGTPKHKGVTGSKHDIIGGKTNVRTLRSFYELVCSKGINSTYNGFQIGDIFANDENFSIHKDNLSGNHIVECSYFRKIPNKNCIIFNYPCDWTKQHLLLQVNFENDKICFSYYNKYKAYSHTDPIIICGNWYKSDKVYSSDKYDDNIIAYECDYISSKQIYDPN